jgi:hypothetical protein
MAVPPYLGAGAFAPAPEADGQSPTPRRHSPPQICRTEGVICFEVARDV